MAKQPLLKRSMRKGMRPVPSPILTPPPNIRRQTIEKMRRFLFEEVLVDGKLREELSECQMFAADQAYLVILFHRGEKSFLEVERHSKEGHRVKFFDEKFFDEEEINALNFVLLEEKERGRLDVLLQKLEGKMKEAAEIKK